MMNLFTSKISFFFFVLFLCMFTIIASANNDSMSVIVKPDAILVNSKAVGDINELSELIEEKTPTKINMCVEHIVKYINVEEVMKILRPLDLGDNLFLSSSLSCAVEIPI